MEDRQQLSRGVLMGAIRLAAKVVFIFCCIALTSTVAHAEESLIPDGVGEIENIPELSAEQQTARAQRAEGDMQRIADYIQSLLDQARGDNDIIRITCLNEKLTQANVAHQSFQERVSQHDSAVRSGDTEQMNHVFRMMVILAQRARSLRNEANSQCIGQEELTEYGRTSVTTERDPSITDDETTDWPDPYDILVRPPSASGYY